MHTFTNHHLHKMKWFDEKFLAFKGQQGHAEVKKTPNLLLILHEQKLHIFKKE